MSDFRSAIYVAAGSALTLVIQRALALMWPTKKEVADAHLGLIQQLGQRVDALTEQVSRLQREADQWRERYFESQSEIVSLRAEVHRLESELADVRRRLTQ